LKEPKKHKYWKVLECAGNNREKAAIELTMRERERKREQAVPFYISVQFVKEEEEYIYFIFFIECGAYIPV
jgi:hypothetical protein